MSAQPSSDKPSASNGNLSGRIIKMMALAGIIVAMIGLPVTFYMLGQWIGAHLAANDMTNGYAYAGFFQILYNQTHVSSYQQLSNVLQSLGNTLGIQDVNMLSDILLFIAFILDVPLAVEAHHIYKELSG